MAHFLEKQGFKQQALAVSTEWITSEYSSSTAVCTNDTLCQVELAMALKDMRAGYELAKKSEVSFRIST